MGTVDQNKALVQRAIDEFFNKGALDAADQLFTDNYQWHPADGVSPVMDRNTHKADYSDFRKAMPDMHLDVVSMVAEGDKVVTHCNLTATHRGQLKDDLRHGQVIQPTNKQLQWTATVTHRIENDKIAEGWINYDRAGIDRQLGLYD